MSQATTTLELAALPLPLHRIDNGTIRIGQTRIPLERVVYCHNRGESAESIVEDFPILELADVRAAIAFYLKNRVAVDAYIQDQDKKADEIRAKIESLPGYKERQAYLREKLMRRAKELGLR